MKKVIQSIYAKDRLNRAKKLCCNFWGVDPELVFTKTRDGNVMNAKHSIRYMLSLDNTSIDYAAMNRVILVDDINNKQDILRTTVSDIILSDSTPLHQVDLICELVKRS